MSQSVDGARIIWLRVGDLRPKTGMSKSTIYRIIAENDFPQPYKTPKGGVSVWLESEVDSWMQSVMKSSAIQREENDKAKQKAAILQTGLVKRWAK